MLPSFSYQIRLIQNVRGHAVRIETFFLNYMSAVETRLFISQCSANCLFIDINITWRYSPIEQLSLTKKICASSSAKHCWQVYSFIWKTNSMHFFPVIFNCGLLLFFIYVMSIFWKDWHWCTLQLRLATLQIDFNELHPKSPFSSPNAFISVYKLQENWEKMSRNFVEYQRIWLNILFNVYKSIEHNELYLPYIIRAFFLSKIVKLLIPSVKPQMIVLNALFKMKTDINQEIGRSSIRLIRHRIVV